MSDFLSRLSSIAGTSNQSEIARTLNIPPTTLSNWISRGVSKAGAIKISKAYGVTIEYVLTGQGEMTAKPVQNKPHSKPDSQLDEGDYLVMDFWDEHTPLYDDEFEVPYYKDVELLGGSDVVETDVSDDGRRKLRYAYTAARRAGANPKAIKCMTLRGDSMEELILDGSMIAIDTSKKDIREGKIYAFRHGNILRVKYLIPRPDGGLIIRSHNSSYADEIITGEQMEYENIYIIGWVWNWSSLLVW